MSQERDRFGNGSLATRLRREAAAERPAFSPGLHERFVRRLAVDAGGQRALQPTVAAGPRRRWLVAVMPLAVACVAAAAVTLLIDAAPDRRIVREWEGERPSTGAAVASDRADMDGIVGLERLPMFDEIDAGLRDGVVTLAASILEVPDWTMLAELDARALLDSGESMDNPVAR